MQLVVEFLADSLVLEFLADKLVLVSLVDVLALDYPMLHLIHHDL